MLWLCFCAAVPVPDGRLQQFLTLACAALGLGTAAAASGLLCQQFRAFSCCLHGLLLLTAVTALNNAAVSVGVLILACQVTGFGGSWLLRAGLPGGRSTHGPG